MILPPVFSLHFALSLTDSKEKLETIQQRPNGHLLCKGWSRMILNVIIIALIARFVINIYKNHCSVFEFMYAEPCLLFKMPYVDNSDVSCIPSNPLILEWKWGILLCMQVSLTSSCCSSHSRFSLHILSILKLLCFQFRQHRSPSSRHWHLVRSPRWILL